MKSAGRELARPLPSHDVGSWSTCWASTKVAARYDGAVTYHDSCSGLRELNVKQEPSTLLGSVQGLSLREMERGKYAAALAARSA